jgi:hypothetical protein
MAFWLLTAVADIIVVESVISESLDFLTVVADVICQKAIVL